MSKTIQPIQCTSCGAQNEAEIIAPPNVQNGPHSTVIIVEHPKFVVCTACGTTLYPAVHSINLSFAGLPVPNYLQPSILIPGRPM